MRSPLKIIVTNILTSQRNLYNKSFNKGAIFYPRQVILKFL